MVQISVATLSLAALAGVSIVNAQPIDLDSSSDLASRSTSEQAADLVERGAFGRLGMIFRPLLSSSVRQAGKTTVQGHAKANNVARDLEDFDDLVERDFTDEEIIDLVQRGAFGRLGRILHPLFSSSVRQAGKTAVQGHAKANNVARDLEDFDELLERDLTDEEIVDLVQRGAFGRLGRILHPLFSSSVRQAGKTTVQGHAKANNVARDLEEFDDVLERDFTDDEVAELVQRGAFGRLGRILHPLFSSSVRQAGKTAVQGHAKANKVARRDLDLELDELVERLFADEDAEELLERSYGEESLEDMD